MVDGCLGAGSPLGCDSYPDSTHLLCMENKVRWSVDVVEDLDKRLEDYAAKKGESKGTIIRQAVDRLLSPVQLNTTFYSLEEAQSYCEENQIPLHQIHIDKELSEEEKSLPWEELKRYLEGKAYPSGSIIFLVPLKQVAQTDPVSLGSPEAPDEGVGVKKAGLFRWTNRLECLPFSRKRS